jgi:hypothetical protein
VGLLAKKFTKEGLNLNVMDGLVPMVCCEPRTQLTKTKGTAFQ